MRRDAINAALILRHFFRKTARAEINFTVAVIESTECQNI
jgi:hypothetical protein